MADLSFIVDRREAGQTLAAVLKKRYGISWSHAKRLVEKRHVRVGDQIETDVARRLKPGKRVVLASGTVETRSAVETRNVESGTRNAEKHKPKPTTQKRKAKRGNKEHWDIAIVSSDDSIVVANKPAGLTTMRHREEAAEFGKGKKYLPATLMDLLPRLLGEPDCKLIAVHRIDRDTSGLVIFARTPAAADALSKQFRKHTVDRRYLALTRGVPQAERIESILVPDRGDGRRGSTRKTNPPDGKRAVTLVKVLEQLGGFGLVECRLETGRTHQVRIHLGEFGAPLCGERIYDRPINGRPAPDGSGAPRPLLHAARLGIVHPETGEKMVWDSDPPADFEKVLEFARGTVEG